MLSSTRVGNKGWYEFDITEAYNYWLRPGMSNYGLLFKMRVESASENYWRQFASATYSDSSKLPYITVVYDEPVSIDINPESIRLYVNETFQPAVRANPAGAALGTAYWSSSNTGVVTVNSTTGKMTAVSSGTAVITVSIYTGTSTATGSCSVSVFSGTPPVKTDTVYHIFNANSTKPVSPREGNLTDGGQVWQEGYRPENAYYQKWKAIRLFNGYYVLRSEQSPNLALSGLGDSLQLKDIGSSNSYSDVPTHAQWNITGSVGSGLRMTVRSSGKSICIQNNAVWSGENILIGSTGSKSREFLFIEPWLYVPTTGVTLQDPIYIMKNGGYICMPQITPANATFKRVIWSWEERGNTTDTGITMSNYAWGESTASYTGTVVTGKKEGVYWLRAYCADTNYSDTVDVDVHFLESGPYYFKNRESNKYMSVQEHSQADGAQIVQESFKGEVWQEFYLERDFTTGYIRIKNRNSNKYLGVENNSSAHDTDIKQYAYSKNSAGQQFKIERISGGETIKIIPRTGEGLSPQRVVCVANYVINSDGVHIQQRDFGANDGYYRDEWYIVKLNQNDEVIKNIQKLHNAAKEYSPLDEWRAIELTLQFIRRYRYNDFKFELAAGTIDENFVNYIHDEYRELYDYFAMHDEDERDSVKNEDESSKDPNFYYTTPNGAEIDIPHFAAVYNVLQYNSFGLVDMGIAEVRVDHLGGWAGDLRSMTPRVLYEANYSNDYNVVYNEAKKQIGADESVSLFGIQDLLADVDAFNIYNLKQTTYLYSIGAALIDYYHLGGYSTRFSDFTNNMSRDEIFNLSKDIMTDSLIDVVWKMNKVTKNEDGYKETNEPLDVTDIQMNAICAAYADYIWAKVEAE